MNLNEPTVLILGNYKEFGNIGDDIYRRFLTDSLAKKGIKVSVSAASPKKIDGVILGGGGVLNAVSIKRLEVLEKYGMTMPSAVISAGMEGCVIPDNISDLLINVDIGTVRDPLAWKYGRGSALLGPDLAYALARGDGKPEGQRNCVGFSLRTKGKSSVDLDKMKAICDEMASKEIGRAIDVNSYLRDKFSSRMPDISGIPDFSYDGSIDSYLNKLAQCEIVVCAQYHAIILSIISGCIVCGYIYSKKVEGLVNDLGIGRYFTKDIEEIPNVYMMAKRDMAKIDDRLVSNLHRNAILTHVSAINRFADLVIERFEEKHRKYPPLNL